MSDSVKTFLFLVACLAFIAWMTGPTWCGGSPFEHAPICSGSEK